MTDLITGGNRGIADARLSLRRSGRSRFCRWAGCDFCMRAGFHVVNSGSPGGNHKVVWDSGLPVGRRRGQGSPVNIPPRFYPKECWPTNRRALFITVNDSMDFNIRTHDVNPQVRSGQDLEQSVCILQYNSSSRNNGGGFLVIMNTATHKIARHKSRENDLSQGLGCGNKSAAAAKSGLIFQRQPVICF